MLKRCYKCGATSDNFGKNKATKDGFNNKCKTCDVENAKQYFEEHKLERAVYYKQWYEDNKEEVLESVKQYYEDHKEEIAAYNNQYKKEKRKNDPVFRLICNMRTRLNKAIKDNQKAGSAVSDLGCSINFFRGFIEAQWYDNPETSEPMSWENYGINGWHLDHRMPLSSFNLEDREQFLLACHFSNIQPMWAKDNLSKGNKI